MIETVSLFEVAGELASSTDMDTVLQKIGVAAKKLLDCEASSIMLLDESRKNLYFKVATGEKGKALVKYVIPLGVGVAGWVAKNLKPVIIEDAAKDSRFAGQFDKSSGFVTKSLICVPMFFKSEPLGVLEVLNKTGGKFTERDLSLLASLAGLAAVAVSNTRWAEQQRNFFAHILEVLALAVEAIGPKYVGRPWRSQRLAAYLGRRLSLLPQQLTDLAHASLLYDVGFLAQKNPRYLELLDISSEKGLFAPGDGGREALHAVLGERMLSGIELFRGALPTIRHHHENFDGTGYPDHLKADAIPIGSRIIALVDVVEDVRFQMRSAPTEEIKKTLIREVSSLKATRLDPAVVEAYLSLIAEEEII